MSIAIKWAIMIEYSHILVKYDRISLSELLKTFFGIEQSPKILAQLLIIYLNIDNVYNE